MKFTMQQHKIEFILKFEGNNSLTKIVKKVNIMKIQYMIIYNISSSPRAPQAS